jgi:hypothetical protein
MEVSAVRQLLGELWHPNSMNWSKHRPPIQYSSAPEIRHWSKRPARLLGVQASNISALLILLATLPLKGCWKYVPSFHHIV